MANTKPHSGWVDNSGQQLTASDLNGFTDAFAARMQLIQWNGSAWVDSTGATVTTLATGQATLAVGAPATTALPTGDASLVVRMDA